MRLIGCMKKKCLLFSFILLSGLCLGALPLEAEARYSRSVSLLEYGGASSLYMGDSESVFLGYRSKVYAAGVEASLFYLEEIKRQDLFFSLGNLGGFSVRAALAREGESFRVSAAAGLSFYSMNLDSRAFFSLISAKVDCLFKVVEKKRFSLLTGLSLTAEVGSERKGIGLGLVTSVIYGGGPGGEK